MWKRKKKAKDDKTETAPEEPDIHDAPTVRGKDLEDLPTTPIRHRPRAEGDSSAPPDPKAPVAREPGEADLDETVEIGVSPNRPAARPGPDTDPPADPPVDDIPRPLAADEKTVAMRPEYERKLPDAPTPVAEDAAVREAGDDDDTVHLGGPAGPKSKSDDEEEDLSDVATVPLGRKKG